MENSAPESRMNHAGASPFTETWTSICPGVHRNGTTVTGPAAVAMGEAARASAVRRRAVRLPAKGIGLSWRTRPPRHDRPHGLLIGLDVGATDNPVDTRQARHKNHDSGR